MYNTRKMLFSNLKAVLFLDPEFETLGKFISQGPVMSSGHVQISVKHSIYYCTWTCPSTEQHRTFAMYI